MTDNTPQNPVRIGVGIDTARYGHHVSFLDEQKRTAAPSFHFTETANGYQKVQRTFEKLQGKHPHLQFHIRIDAAGQYAENLLQWLHQLDFETTISVGQPARNKAYRDVHFDKRKADPTESLACARFAVVEKPPASPPNPPEFQQLRDTVALLEAAATQKTRLVNQLHGLLARVFPELAVHASDLSANWVLTLLEKYPTPEKLARAQSQTLAKIPHLSQAMAETLQKAAAESTGSSRGPVAEQLIRQKVRAIRRQQAESRDLDKLLETAWKALPEGPHHCLITIPGIGLHTAAALVAKIVSIDRFRSPKALVGYFGVFPEEVDVSGTDRQGQPKRGTTFHMSRKGNDLVRRFLYMAAQSAAKWNPAVKALFTRLMAAGKSYNVAIGHCMAKLLHQVFALWTKDCDFDPEFETRTEPKESQDTESLISEKAQAAAGHKNAVESAKTGDTATSSSRVSSKSGNKLPPLNFAKLREQVSIQKVLEQIGWTPQETRGAQWRGSCPLHESLDATSRCFAVETEQHMYCCHRCGSQGNALDLWTAFCERPLLEAAWDLVKVLGLEPPLLKEEPPEANH
jgi:transposase